MQGSSRNTTSFLIINNLKVKHMETKRINDKYYVKAKVVMLATDKKEIGVLCLNTFMFKDTKEHIKPRHQLHQIVTPTGIEALFNPKHDYLKTQHLYIITDDKINEGNWYYSFGKTSEYSIHKCDSKRLVNISNNYNCKKIIASTDPSLNLPSPSQSFITKYITEWNKGNKIENVLIECYSTHETEYEKFLTYKVAKDNTITIIKSKDNWSREELPISILQDMIKYCEDKAIYDKLGAYGDFYYKAKNWITNNL